MRVTFSARPNNGPSFEMHIEQGDWGDDLKLVFSDDIIIVNGLDLWRAVLALMSDPVAHKVKRELRIGTGL